MERAKRVLVTGISGFIGTAVASRLMESGLEVSGIVRSKQSSVSERFGHAKIYEYPKPDQHALREILVEAQPDTIVHLAAAGVSTGASDIDGLLRANLDFSIDLIRVAAELEVPQFVHTGSCFEYAPNSSNRNLNERDFVEPFSLYGATKAASVMLALSLGKQLNLPVTVLRLFGVYGPGEAPQRLVPSLIRGLSNFHPIELTSGTQVRDWLYIDDAANAIQDAVLKFDDLEVHSVYNVSTGIGTTVREVGETLASVMGRPRSLLRWGSKASREGEPARIVGDVTRFQSAIGWKPKFDLVNGLQAAVHELMPQMRLAA